MSSENNKEWVHFAHSMLEHSFLYSVSALLVLQLVLSVS